VTAEEDTLAQGDSVPADTAGLAEDAQTNPAGVRRSRVSRAPRWWTSFPYHWDSDELVGRRALLRLTVVASGALFAATAGIAALSKLRPVGQVSRQFVARVSDVPPGGVKYFAYPGSDDQAVLLRLNEETFVAYSQRCTHLSCAVYFDDQRRKLVCPCHDGVFDPQTGAPVAGPPQRPLSSITLQQDGDSLYALAEVPHET
jgi:nitrite reductase/ring-hydroxylating ferredoxin subunit